MSLAFDFGVDRGAMGAAFVSHSPWADKRPASLAFARLVEATGPLLRRGAAFLRDGMEVRAIRRPSVGDHVRTIRAAFETRAADIGLTEEESAILSVGGALSGVILALELLEVAVSLFKERERVAAWLRDQNADKPFQHRSPLETMACEGQLAVELILLRLRTQLRAADLYAERTGRVSAAPSS